MEGGAALYIVIWVVCGLIGGAIGKSKGRGGQGFALGLILGLIGIIIIAVLKSKQDVQLGVPVAAYGGGATSPAGWFPDPHRRYEMRYWDGSRWTEHVTSGGRQASDPVPG